MKSIFRLEVRGRKNIPGQGGLILAANHRSYLDPAVLAVAFPRPVFFLAKEGLFIRNALFGRFITALNALPIKSKSGDLKTLRRIISELKAGKVVLVFPEGRRLAGGENVHPMKGVGLLAVKANVPIVPALIEGSAQALPINSSLIRPHKIRVYFGQPIFPQSVRDSVSEQDKDEIYQILAEKTMRVVTQLKQ
ncbi:MAG: lysophospholipid acyltransferase family protein [Candidatus Omnitrophota bacterium]